MVCPLLFVPFSSRLKWRVMRADSAFLREYYLSVVASLDDVVGIIRQDNSTNSRHSYGSARTFLESISRFAGRGY